MARPIPTTCINYRVADLRASKRPMVAITIYDFGYIAKPSKRACAIPVPLKRFEVHREVR